MHDGSELVGSKNLTAGAGWSIQQAHGENVLLSISPAPEHAENNINSTRADCLPVEISLLRI